jgi:hypothetical protein
VVQMIFPEGLNREQSIRDPEEQSGFASEWIN